MEHCDLFSKNSFRKLTRKDFVMFIANYLYENVSYYLGFGLTTTQPTENLISTIAQETIDSSINEFDSETSFSVSLDPIPVLSEEINAFAARILKIAEDNGSSQPNQTQLDCLAQIYGSIDCTNFTTEEEDTLLLAMLTYEPDETPLAISLIKQLTEDERSWYQIAKCTEFVMFLWGEENELLSSIIASCSGLSFEEFRHIRTIPADQRYRELKVLNALLKSNEKEVVFSRYRELSEIECNKIISTLASGYVAELVDLEEKKCSVRIIHTDESQCTQK
jgi:hypothetical protein